jgi:hypothetical protein
MRTARPGLILGASLGLLSCFGGSTGPAEGSVTLELHSPNDDDGAVLFTLTGGPVEAIESPGNSVYYTVVDPATIRVVIAGDLGSGALARVRIADRDQAAQYAGVVEQVAQRSSFAQRDPAGYRLTAMR